MTRPLPRPRNPIPLLRRRWLRARLRRQPSGGPIILSGQNRPKLRARAIHFPDVEVDVSWGALTAYLAGFSLICHGVWISHLTLAARQVLLGVALLLLGVALWRWAQMIEARREADRLQKEQDDYERQAAERDRDAERRDLPEGVGAAE